MKKFIFVICLFAIVFAQAVPMYATNSKPEATVIDITKENMYYNEELGANVVSFTINSDGTVNYLTKEEANIIKSKRIDRNPTFVDDYNNEPNDYHQWYEFKQTGGPYHYSGDLKKVSADIKAPAGGGSVSTEISYTATHFFSASINTSQKESAVQAGASIGWEKSASRSDTYTMNLLPGQTGYIGFKPYYNQVIGDLELYGSWGDGLIDTTPGVAGYSVKLTADGDADGMFEFVEIN